MQMTIFDFLNESAEYDLATMTTADMARVIGEAIGLDFKPTGWEDEHQAKVKNLKLTIHKEHYLCDVGDKKEGDPFIGCAYDRGLEGGGSPIDSIEDAIAWFRKKLEKGGSK